MARLVWLMVLGSWGCDGSHPAARDTGTIPGDTGTVPDDTGTTPDDTGTTSADAGGPPDDGSARRMDGGDSGPGNPTDAGARGDGGTSGGLLRWAPPGYDGVGDPGDPGSYPGFQVLGPVTDNAFLQLDDSTDYFVVLHHAQWSSGSSGRTGITIAGGRHVVIIGGRVTFAATNDVDDQSAFIINDGNPDGVVHIEGVFIERSVNGITVRTRRTVQIENVRAVVRAWNDDHASIHPDLVQIWDRGPCRIRMHRFSGFSTYTGLSVLLQDPEYWRRYDVDIHGLPPLDGSVPLLMGAVVYRGFTTHAQGDNLWAETGWYSATIRRKLDDVLIRYASTGTQTRAPYELLGVDGTSYESPLVPTGGDAPYPLGTRTGDRITFSRAPTPIEETWIQGKPSVADGASADGSFVSESLVGVDYASPGYL